MQHGLRALLLFILIITGNYPHTAACANKVVVIPLEADRPNLSNIVTVAKSGGDYSNIIRAVRSINDASAANPYVVYIAPGVYDTTEPIILPSYVSLIGSGVASTIINANFDRQTSTFGTDAGIPVGFHNEVANLSLNRTSDSTAVGLFAANALPQQAVTQVSYTNLKVNVAAPSEARAVVNDFNGSGARFAMEDLQIDIVGDNVFSAGVQNIGIGGLQVFRRLSMTLEGGGSVFGITNSEGVRLELIHSDINITTVANSTIIGIRNRSGSRSDVRDTKIIAGGARFSSVGVSNQSSSSSRIENSQIRGFLTPQAQTAIGVENRDNTSSARIIYSNIVGDTRPVVARNGSGIRETYISFSSLSGDNQTSGSPVCRFNVNEENIALTTNCREP